MLGGDGLSAGQVGNRPRDADDAVEAAGREVKLVGRALQQAPAGDVQWRVFLQLRPAELCVHPRAGATGELTFSGRQHAFANGRRRFSGGAFSQGGDRDRLDFDNQIQAIAQRPGQPATVTRDLRRRAVARACRIAQVPTRTPPRCLFVRRPSNESGKRMDIPLLSIT